VLPAIQASLARVPEGRRVDVLVQVADAADDNELSSPGDLRVRWIHEPGDAVLADAIRGLEWPDGEVHAFVHGEASAVREVRRLLLGERGLPREAVSISGYWKRTRTEEGWRDDKPEWNRLVEADLASAA
jgi:NADPH-dependent ferric siderophore reductase